jgi:hypothetical protein
MWYHGTPRWKDILDKGINIDAPKHSDPGDFGWGIYLTAKLIRAKIYGRVFIVEIDTSKMAYVSNPYFLDGLRRLAPVTAEEQLFYSLAYNEDGEMLTLQGTKEERIAAARRVQRGFLDAGYSGIVSDYDEGEAVLFESAPILSAKLSQK